VCWTGCPSVDAEGDCVHCWNDGGDDGFAGTRPNRRKKPSRATLDRSRWTRTIGNHYVGGRGHGCGDVGSDGSDGGSRALRLPLLADRET
jgi:hypothetical protein